MNLTLQQIFSHVALHLHKQGAQALNAQKECAYRDEQGRSCAVGCLIPDKYYTPAIEGPTVRAARPDNPFTQALVSDGLVGEEKLLALRDALLKSGVDLSDRATADLLQDLQKLHDDDIYADCRGTWRAGLVKIAHKFQLQMPAES